MTGSDLLGCVGAYRHDLDFALVELGPKFLPSPQLGDTVGSPVATEELQKDGLTGCAGDRELVAIFIERREVPKILADSDHVVRDPLWADKDQNGEEETSEGRDTRRNTTDPARALGQGVDAEPCPDHPARDEASSILWDLHALHSPRPQSHGSCDQEKAGDTKDHS